MNLSEFQNSLLKNYDQHRGPFNWLAGEYDSGIYSYLSTSDRKNAVALVYANHADTIGNITEQTSPIEKILRRPAKFQELFELIVCATLIGLLKESKGGTRFNVGDCLLPSSAADTEKLKEQFETFKTTLPVLTDAWVQDLKRIWGTAAIVTWVGYQIAFLNIRLKSFAAGLKKNDLISKDRGNSTEAMVDAYSVVSCEVIDCANLSIDEAMADLEKLVGLSDVKRKVLGLVAASAYGEAREIACAVTAPPAFSNFIISGPPGVGKTTSAKLVGKLLAASGLLKNKVIVQITASALIGVFTGTTEAKIADLFKRGRGGVIIIDEVDSLATRDAVIATRSHEMAIDTLNALIGYEKDNDTGTVVIMTGYEAGIQNLLNKNLGLRRRFPNYIAMSSYDATVLMGIFKQMLDARSYKFKPEIVDAAIQQIMDAKAYMGENFGNAGTVEEFIGVMEAGRAQRVGLSDLRQIIVNKTAAPEMISKLSELAFGDIPVFDKQAKVFKSGGLSLVRDAQRS